MLCNQRDVSIEQNENTDAVIYFCTKCEHIIGNCENDDRTNKHYSYF